MQDDLSQKFHFEFEKKSMTSKIYFSCMQAMDQTQKRTVPKVPKISFVIYQIAPISSIFNHRFAWNNVYFRILQCFYELD